MSSTRPSTAIGGALAALLLLSACAASNPSRELAQVLERMQPHSVGKAKPAVPAAQPVAQPAPGMQELVANGDQARDSGNRSTAVWNYLRANSLDATDPTPRERLAALHLADDPDRAAAIFQGLIQQDPNYASGYAGLGLAQLRLGDFTGAGSSLERAVELDPLNATALSALGVVYDTRGQYAQAQANYRSAHDLRPQDWEILNNLGYSLILSGDVVGAVETLRRAVRLQPDDPGLQNNLGLALGRLGQYDAALAAFRRGGGEQAAQNNLGWVHALNGENDAARQRFEAALTTRGESSLQVVENIRSTSADEAPLEQENAQ